MLSHPLLLRLAKPMCGSHGSLAELGVAELHHLIFPAANFGELAANFDEAGVMMQWQAARGVMVVSAKASNRRQK